MQNKNLLVSYLDYKNIKLELRLFNNIISYKDLYDIKHYHEPNDSFYKPVILENDNWMSIEGNNFKYPEVVFNFSEEDNIYGYFISTSDKEELVGFVCHQFYVFPGESIIISPQISLGHKECFNQVEIT